MPPTLVDTCLYVDWVGCLILQPSGLFTWNYSRNASPIGNSSNEEMKYVNAQCVTIISNVFRIANLVYICHMTNFEKWKYYTS